MMAMRVLCLLLAGCGRIAFAPVAGDAGTADAAPRVERLPCNERVLLDSGGDRQQDSLAWVTDGASDWLVASLHNSDTDHPIERFAIEDSASAVHLVDTGAIHQTVHAHHIAVSPTPTGHVMAFYDEGTMTASALSLDPGLNVRAVHSLGALVDGDPPLVRAGGGGLVVVGVAGGIPVAQALDDDGAPTGLSRGMAGAEQPDFPTAIPLDEGFAAVWQAGGGTVCRLIVLHADLSIATGPVSMSTTACSRPQIAWLPGAQRFVVAADDPNTGRVIAAVFSSSLAQIVPTFTVTPAGYGAQIIDDVDGAWIAWVRTSDAALGYARVAADGGLTPAVAAFGHIDTVNMHYHVLQHVAGSAVAVWGDVDQGFSFAAARLCR